MSAQAQPAPAPAFTCTAEHPFTREVQQERERLLAFGHDLPIEHPDSAPLTLKHGKRLWNGCLHCGLLYVDPVKRGGRA